MDEHNGSCMTCSACQAGRKTQSVGGKLIEEHCLARGCEADILRATIRREKEKVKALRIALEDASYRYHMTHGRHDTFETCTQLGCKANREALK